MTVFGKYEFLLKICGLDPHGGRKNIIGRAFYSVASLLLYFSTSMFFILNFRRDINRVLTLLPLFLSTTPLIAIHFHLIINREQFYSLLRDLEDIVHESV